MMYDEELAYLDVINLFKNKFNTEIGCVNTEKVAVTGDTLFLEDIPITKYVPVTMGTKQLLNYKGFFVSYGLTKSGATNQQEGNFVDEMSVMVEVATFDDGIKNPDDLYLKLLRYRKAMKNLVMKNPDVFRGYAKPSVESLVPASFPYDSRRTILSIGLVIKASFTAF